MYCACHEICISGSPSGVPATKSTRPAAAGQRRPRAPQLIQDSGSPSAVPATKSTRQAAAGQRRPRAPQLIQEALCTAPATKSALQVHQALCLPRNLHDRQPRASADHARRSWSGRLCHEIRAPRLIQEALCPAPATKSAFQWCRMSGVS